MYEFVAKKFFESNKYVKDWNGISKDMIMQYAGQYQLLTIEK